MNIIERNGFLVANGFEMTEIAGRAEYDDLGGWNSSWGEEMVFQHIVPNINTGQSVVDLAGAIGRVSFAFSMLGYEVTMVDINEYLMDRGNQMRKDAGARQARTLIADIRNISRDDFGNKVGAVLAYDALMYLEKEDADKAIGNMPKLLDSNGGYIYLNVPATESPIYRQPGRYGAVRTGQNTLRVRTGCHGGSIESGYFDFGELDARLALSGGEIINSETRNKGSGVVMCHEVMARFSPVSLGKK
jgi:hypothetical protein